MKVNVCGMFVCRVLVAVAVSCGVMGQAHAVYTCSVSSTGISATYNPTDATALDVQSTATITCSRSAASDNRNLNWSLGINDGSNASGTQNRARVTGTANYLSYELYRDSARTQLWGNTSGTDRFTSASALVLTSTNTNYSTTVTYYMRVPAAQYVAAGTYADTVTLSLYQGTTGTTLLNSATFPVSVALPATCAISSSPGTIQFSYTSFQTTPATGSTQFAVRCTSGSTYTMGLDATTGTINDVNYTLAITPTGTQTGTGLAQQATISGTVPANQSGTCKTAVCTGTQTRTLTITY